MFCYTSHTSFIKNSLLRSIHVANCASIPLPQGNEHAPSFFKVDTTFSCCFSHIGELVVVADKSTSVMGNSCLSKPLAENYLLKEHVFALKL